MRSPGEFALQVTDDRFLNVLAAAEVGGFGLEVEKPDAHDRAGVSGGRDVGSIMPAGRDSAAIVAAVGSRSGTMSAARSAQRAFIGLDSDRAEAAGGCSASRSYEF